MFRGGKVVLFEIPELDYIATKRNVMKAMDKYEWCLMRIDTSSHPKVNQSCTRKRGGDPKVNGLEVEGMRLYPQARG